MRADELRRAWTAFFVERGHTAAPSAGLIPHHPRAPLFTNAGMNQFLPYFLGEEPPPFPRATSIQKCVRVKGKHDDIENIGRSTRHLSFFEMMGNFSFGDYFKEQAIPLAWELSTEVLGLDGDRIWVTVHTTDDEADAIWRDTVGVPPERIQRMGADNFWEMGDTGPCGPCSELYFDRGERFGAPGGPANGGDERYAEFWNLVFMQYDRQADGALPDLPRKNIDTGAGYERILAILQDTRSVFETDLFVPIVGRVGDEVRTRYGDDDESDVSMRIIADHARTMAFLVNDGVVPSNEDRGYVLRRVIRRAVRHAYSRFGVERELLPGVVDAVIEVMGPAYPDLVRNGDHVKDVVAREEHRFLATIRNGLRQLEDELAAGHVGGEAAFKLHDTFGFPIDLTRELAAERGVDVDMAGFESAMAEQRDRAKRASVKVSPGGDVDYRAILEQVGPTEFTGYAECESKARVGAVVERGDGTVEAFLDRSPFYAEGGGQIGDTGTITTDTGILEVIDTTYALPALHRHLARVVEGVVEPGQEATASVDGTRRDAIRRNHTGTHMLHWALREVLGNHVKQAGSYVGPDRLRFDFSHYAPVSDDELARVEDLANERVIANEPVRAYETSMEEAQRLGAVMFFGDKYGDFVRVVESGTRSMELCGGTHVDALGMIGPIKIVSEGSIGSNLRRIEALTGAAALDHVRAEEQTLSRAATLLRVKPEELVERVEREIDTRRALEDELKALRRKLAGGESTSLAADAVDGVVVARRDGTTRDELRDLAVALRDQSGVRAVVLGGEPDGGGAALVAAVAKDSGLTASDLIAEAAKLVGGGGGKNPDLAMAGGRDPSKLDAALDAARRAAGISGTT